jgi:hypothetical protein
MNEWAEHMDPAQDAKRARARRNAWVLGALVVLFYVGVLAWYVIKSGFGG